MYGYKRTKAHQSADSAVTDSHQFKTIRQLYNKTFSHCTTFLSAVAFFPWLFLNCIFFLNCCRQHELRFPALIHVYLKMDKSPENG